MDRVVGVRAVGRIVMEVVEAVPGRGEVEVRPVEDEPAVRGGTGLVRTGHVVDDGVRVHLESGRVTGADHRGELRAVAQPARQVVRGWLVHLPPRVAGARDRDRVGRWRHLDGGVTGRSEY